MRSSVAPPIDRLVLVAALLVCAAACGKKGPPLPPLARVPAAGANVPAARLGDDVYVSFVVPNANVDGKQPADIAVVEVFGITAVRPPETEKERELATLVGSLPVHPLELDGAVAPAELAAARSAIPGVDRGATAVMRESLTPASALPVEFPPKPGAVPPSPSLNSSPVFGPLVAPLPTELPRRYYFVVGRNSRKKKGAASTPVAAVLDATGAPPGQPVVSYTEKVMTVEWPPSPTARTATLETPTPVAAGAATPAASVPGNATPAVVVPPVLTAKSLGFNTQATTYHVFEVPADTAPSSPAVVTTLPAALTPTPVAATSFSIAGVVFGAARCFLIRAVDVVSGVPAQSAASPSTCVTPRDTFPPAAPRALGAIAGAGVISLIWEPNAEPDLAGYRVLRGVAPGDTLLAVTPEPIRETTYRDTSVRPGVRYVYVVVALDTADPPNISGQSNRVEETARQ